LKTQIFAGVVDPGARRGHACQNMEWRGH